MIIMVISDIHGNIETLRTAIEQYRMEKAERLIILGDFAGYLFSSNDYEVAEELNTISGRIVAVRGNCDSEYIEKAFRFNLEILKNIELNNQKITITHGNVYNKSNIPSDCGRIFLYGHTHYGFIEKEGQTIIANPGSISRPRGGSKKSYIILDENEIILKELNGKEIKKMTIV